MTIIWMVSGHSSDFVHWSDIHFITDGDGKVLILYHMLGLIYINR